MREEAAAVEARAADAATAREALRLTEGSAGADAKNAYKELKAASQRQVRGFVCMAVFSVHGQVVDLRNFININFFSK